MPSRTYDSLRSLPLLIWLLVQLLLLLVPVAQVPLSDKFPRPPESMAIDEMLIGQIAFSALLLPMLFPSWATSLAVIASTWPFVLLAAVLSATPQEKILLTGIYLSAWLLMLACWSYIFISPNHKLLASAVASLVSIGTTLLQYLQIEFSFNSTHLAKASGALHGPIGNIISILHGAPESINWLMPASVLLASILAAITFAIRRSQKNLEPIPGAA